MNAIWIKIFAKDDRAYSTCKTLQNNYIIKESYGLLQHLQLMPEIVVWKINVSDFFAQNLRMLRDLTRRTKMSLKVH